MRGRIRLLPLVGLMLAVWNAVSLNAGSIRIEPEQADFGKASNSSMIYRRFVLENTSDESVEILDIKSTCGCLTATVPFGHLAPGGTRYVEARLNLKGRRGRLEKAFQVRTSDPEQPIVWASLSGEAVGVFTVEPAVIDFGAVPQDLEGQTNLSRRVSVRSTQGRPFGIQAIYSRRNLVGCEVFAREDGRAYDIVFDLQASSLEPGRLRDTIQIHTDLPGSTPISLVAGCAVPGKLVVVPNPLRYSSAVTTPQRRYLTVRSSAREPFRVLSASCFHRGGRCIRVGQGAVRLAHWFAESSGPDECCSRTADY